MSDEISTAFFLRGPVHGHTQELPDAVRRIGFEYHGRAEQALHSMSPHYMIFSQVAVYERAGDTHDFTFTGFELRYNPALHRGEHDRFSNLDLSP